MKNILVLYYTQSGQLRDILAHLVKDIKDQASIDFVEVEPVTPFPWPWNAYEFFDAMPETVQRIGREVKPLPVSVHRKQYDLVILGYQPWFLNPSQPITGFLHSNDASILAGKPVITVVGSRNMWLNSQEQIKQDLNKLNATLIGNIVLIDKQPNLISTLTVVRWAFSGQKEASGWLPAAGVHDEDIRATSKFGAIILKHLSANTLQQLQPELLSLGAISLDPGLVLLEQRGIKNFRYWSKFIREKGGPGDPNRKPRVKLFQRLLFVGIFILSPLSSLTAFIKLQFKKKSLLKDVDYFKSVHYEKGRI